MASYFLIGEKSPAALFSRRYMVRRRQKAWFLPPMPPVVSFILPHWKKVACGGFPRLEKSRLRRFFQDPAPNAGGKKRGFCRLRRQS
jgi:hypothetical protein